MNGYSRIPHSVLQKSRSSDFSDLVCIPKFQQKPTQNPTMIINRSSTQDLHQQQQQQSQSQSQEAEEEGVGEIFGVILGRRHSASSASFHGLSSGCDKHSAAADDGASAGAGAVKRAFSMRRSSSVSEGYSRIHHQCCCDDVGALQRSSRKKKKSSNILKACRRLFGF